MIDTIEYRGMDIPAPPVCPDDEPECEPEAIASVNSEYAMLPPMGCWERREVWKLLDQWRSIRPAMWARLNRAKMAKKLARIRLAREAKLEREVAAEAARRRCPLSEVMLDMNTNYWWRFAEDDEYESALDDWREQAGDFGVDPDDVLAFLRGEQPEWDEDSE